MHMYIYTSYEVHIIYGIKTPLQVIRTYLLLSLRLECPVVSELACVVSVRSPLPLELIGGGTAGPDDDGVDNAPAIVAKARTISDWEPPPVAILKNMHVHYAQHVITQANKCLVYKVYA